jgi:hypothetical protein
MNAGPWLCAAITTANPVAASSRRPEAIHKSNCFMTLSPHVALRHLIIRAPISGCEPRRGSSVLMMLTPSALHH